MLFLWWSFKIKSYLHFIKSYSPNCVCCRATLVLSLVQGGEKTLRDGLGLDGVSTAKLNESICAQLCDAGMQALEKATRSASVFFFQIYFMMFMLDML